MAEKYALLSEKGVIVQIQTIAAAGFVSVPDGAVCGMRYVDGVLSIPELTAEEIETRRVWGIVGEITALESQITSRRMREAILTNDLSFIQGIESQIAELRKQL